MIEDSLTYIGTATVLMEINGIKILVDPAFYHGDERQHLGWGLFSKRLVPPAFNVEEVNPDLILITHTHQDHYDKTAKNGLSKEIPVITNHKAASSIQGDGFTQVTGLKVNEETDFEGIKIKAMPARHGPLFMRPFVGHSIGFGLTFGENKLWISGDTIGFNGLIASLKQFSPNAGIIYFGGVKAYMIRLTFDGKDAFNTINGTSLNKIHGVHIDDWKHFKTKREDLEEQFKGSKINLKLPKHGEKSTLW